MQDKLLAGNNVRRVLLISLGGFGDTILATPLADALRRRFPDAQLCALAMWASSGEILKHLNVFDEVIVHDFFASSKVQSLKRIASLHRRRFDLSVNAFPSNRGHYNVLARLIGARCRLGHDYLAGGNLSYGRFLLTDRLAQQPGGHCVQENLAIAEALGAKVRDDEPTSVSSLGEDQIDWAKAFLQDSSGPVLGLHPGSSLLKNHTQRRWPAVKYAHLAKQFIDCTGGTALTFLGPDEMDLAAIFQEEAPDAVLVRSEGIGRVAALVRRCDVFLCSDSSLGHLAAACGIPVAMILGPTNPDFIRPWGVAHRIISRHLDCSPCFVYSSKPLDCRNTSQYSCVRGIAVADVMAACMELLEETARVDGL